MSIGWGWLLDSLLQGVLDSSIVADISEDGPLNSISRCVIISTHCLAFRGRSVFFTWVDDLIRQANSFTLYASNRSHGPLWTTLRSSELLRAAIYSNHRANSSVLVSKELNLCHLIIIIIGHTRLMSQLLANTNSGFYLLWLDQSSKHLFGSYLVTKTND